jgi:hypothetical protein
MHSPELVAAPCPECRCSPVDFLKQVCSGTPYLWCPLCRALWVCHALTAFAAPEPLVIAFGPASMRRPLPS